MAALREVATAPDFEILPGHYVVEARPRGIHKGAALKALIGHPPFAGRKPVFVGDDRTDEDGFRALRALDGRAVTVHVGEASGDIATAAEFTVPDPAGLRELLDWLVVERGGPEPAPAD